MLLKQPTITTVAVLSLGLGIGANSTIFTMVNAVFLTAIPVHEPSRLAMVYTAEWEFPDLVTGVSFKNYEHVRDASNSFSEIAAYTQTSLNLAPPQGEAQEIVAQLVTGSFFDVLGVPAFRGRTFLPEEDLTPTPVVVLSHGLWERQFGADPSVIGQELNIANRPFTVVGVTPPGFKGWRLWARRIVSGSRWRCGGWCSQVFSVSTSS